MKLAEVDKVADIPTSLAEMQSSLDLATLEESKEQALGESKIAQDDAKAYGHNMSESFGKQIVSQRNSSRTLLYETFLFHLNSVS